jgi:hypothetical protein
MQNQENSRSTNILTGDQYVEKKWKDIKVGHIIKIMKNE